MWLRNDSVWETFPTFQANASTLAHRVVLGSVLGTYPFIASFTLMWDWGRVNGFDVDTGSTQNMHSR